MASHNFVRTELPFPPELVHEIVSLLPPSTDLRSIALVSRTLRDVVQSIILRRISIGTVEGSHIPFLDAVISAPNRIGAYVRKYDFDANGAYKKSSDDVAQALRLMVNLKHFKYHDRYCNSKSPPIIESWQIRLTSLHWHMRTVKLEDPLFRIFLPTQPQLKHLTIENLENITDDKWASAEGLCPNLESLGGPLSVMALFFKGRKILYLKWYADQEGRYEELANGDQFKDEFEKLEFLEYSSSCGRSWLNNFEVGIPLPRIAKYLNNVRVLTVDVRRIQLRDDLYNSGSRWPHGVYKSLTSLEIIQLRMEPGTVHRNPKKDEEAVQSIFSNCDSLQRIYAELFGDQIYMKYTNETADRIEFAFKAEYAYAKEVLLWEKYATRE